MCVLFCVRKSVQLAVEKASSYIYMDRIWFISRSIAVRRPYVRSNQIRSLEMNSKVQPLIYDEQIHQEKSQISKIPPSLGQSVHGRIKADMYLGPAFYI